MNGFILFCSRFALSLHQIVVIMTIKEFFSFRQNKYFWINILAMIAVVVLLMFGTLKGMIMPSLRCIRQKQSVSFCLWHDVRLILYDH